MNRRAFTLIELLLGLILFSIIGLSLYSVFASGIRVSRISNEDVESYRQARWALDIMAQDLENMSSLNFGEDSEIQAFTTERGQISFPLSVNDEIKRVSYYLENPNTDSIHKVLIGNTYSKNVDIVIENTTYEKVNFLIREEVSFLNVMADERHEDLEREVIATNIKTNGLRFLFGVAQGEQTVSYEWEEIWANANIPANVRIEMDVLIDDDGDQKEIIVFKDVLIPQGVYGGEEI